MSLSSVIGKSNSLEVLEALKGETIAGAFEDRDGKHMVIVMESGVAFVLTSLGGTSAPPFWVEDAPTVEWRRQQTREALLRVQEQIEHLDAMITDLVR